MKEVRDKMGTVELILGIVLLVLSVALVAAVLMQSGKDKKLSGAIAGGADTFFGKGKTGRWDKLLSNITVVMASVFGVLVIVMYIIAA